METKENIVFTQEMLNLLYERCKQHCLAKHGVEIDHVQIVDGDVYGFYDNYSWGYSNPVSYDISIYEINNENYDKLIEERLENERIKKEKEKERVRLAQIEYNKRKEREEMEQYLALKNKFEK